MLKMQPKRIVYVSCDPATLARDLHILTQGGYKVAKVQCVDMFAHSVHVETCALLVKSSVSEDCALEAQLFWRAKREQNFLDLCGFPTKSLTA